jgi:hypothetical protein
MVFGGDAVPRSIDRLPASIALRALDLTAWCEVSIAASAIDAVGPARDLPQPLREWLLRAAGSGRVELVAGNAKETGREPPLPELAPSASPSVDWLRRDLAQFDLARLGAVVTAPEDARALAAGLWQMNDELERSHELAQSVEGAGRHRSGDYWHAIMHRREPDDSNAKYWVRHVGRHPIHEALAREADRILSSAGDVPHADRWRTALAGGGWSGAAFVDLCSEARRRGPPSLSRTAGRIQLTEMVLLLAETWTDAIG